MEVVVVFLVAGWVVLGCFVFGGSRFFVQNRGCFFFCGGRGGGYNTCFGKPSIGLFLGCECVHDLSTYCQPTPPNKQFR